MTPGDLFYLAGALCICNIVLTVIYFILFPSTKQPKKTFLDCLVEDAVTPPGPEWVLGECESCKKKKSCHIGYGQCYACIHGA